MVSSDIWMGSGATVSMIPEQNINLGSFNGIAAASGNQRVITLNTTFTNNFSLVANLYRGCYLNIHAVSGNALTDRVLIQANDATTLTVNDSLASAITDTPTDYYGVIEQYGAPVPAPKGAGGSDTYTAQVLSVQFKSDTAADYEDVAIIFGTLDAESETPTESDVGIFLTTDGTYGNLAGLVAETEDVITVNIGDAQLTTAEEYIDAVIHQINLTSGIDFSATRDGDKLIITNSYGGTVSRTPGTDDGGADSTIDSLDAASTSTIELSVTTAGATVSASGANPRLLSDTWLGLVSSVTVPSTNVTTEQMNLVAGGTRNFIYQYKGIEETSGGSIDMMANSFWPLYYALGRKRLTSTNTTSVTGANLTQFAVTQGGLISSSGTNFIFDNDADTSIDTIRRVEGTTICPPLANSDDISTNGAFHLLNRTNVGDHITYTITEENGHTLPSFALEYTLKKADQNATVAVDSAKENVYTKIYPGTVINSLTMNADVAGPVNMNLSLAHKNTFVAPSNYETLNNATDVKEFINYRGRQGQTETLALDTDADTEALMRPFFFADGTISLFGQDYIRLASFNLTIDNQLQAQRYIGRYDKNSQVQLTGQRTYTLSFTGHVTDAEVFTELQNQLTTALSVDDASEIVLRFTKENGEELELKFGDYMVTSADFPVGNDRGPVVVNWTIQPLSLRGCTHTTYWAIQG